jgi:hypothetical protein
MIPDANDPLHVSGRAYLDTPYRSLQRPTAICVTRKRRATARLNSSDARARTICARCVNAAGIESEHAIEDNCDFSASLKISSVFGRPIAIAVSPVSKMAG